MKRIVIVTAVLGVAASAAYAAGEMHWSYSGKAGPDQWGKLSKDFEACDVGIQQSPINLTDAQERTLADIKLAWKAGDMKVLNNGHTIQVQGGDMGSAYVEGEEFRLLQYHFHLPSEHAVEGARSPMEVHFVHKHNDGRLAVIGVMMDAGGKNELFSNIMAAAPKTKGEADLAQADATGLVGELADFYRYQGSLTTPPCSEIVTWTVLHDAVSVDGKDIEDFGAIFPMNARPLQEVKEHEILVN